MNETYVTMAGVVAGEPRAAALDGTLRVTNFRMASSARWRDRGGQWVDGPTTWVNVTCWRGLAANVAESLARRDRVIVRGRLRTRTWHGDDGLERTSLEIEADSVGHDLAYGTSRFTRVRRAEPVETPERQEVDELIRQSEMDALRNEAVALDDPDDDDDELPESLLAVSR